MLLPLECFAKGLYFFRDWIVPRKVASAPGLQICSVCGSREAVARITDAEVNADDAAGRALTQKVMSTKVN